MASGDLYRGERGAAFQFHGGLVSTVGAAAKAQPHATRLSHVKTQAEPSDFA